MSIFENLERQHAAGLLDLTAAINLSGGLEDVLKRVEQVGAVEAVTKILDLQAGAAAALRAADIAEIPHGSGDQRAASTPEVWPLTTVRTSTDGSVDNSQERGEPASPSLQATASLEPALRLLRRIDGIIEDLKRAIATDDAYSLSLSGAQSDLVDLAVKLQGRQLSREEAEGRILEIRQLLRQARDEVRAAGYAPRVNSVDNEVLALRGRVHRLFDPSKEFQYSQSDH